MKHTKEWWDSQGLWDHFNNRPCVGAEKLVEAEPATAVDIGPVEDLINGEIDDTRRKLTDEELRVLWRISHGDFIVYGRMVELSHGVE